MSSDSILLNEHALNSLKRAQLVALCKRYELRATGKNTELVARLEEFGHREPVTNTWTTSNNSIGANSQQSAAHEVGPRPSEAWSVVDDPSDGETHMPGAFAPSQEFGGGHPSVKSESLRCFTSRIV